VDSVAFQRAEDSFIHIATLDKHGNHTAPFLGCQARNMRRRLRHDTRPDTAREF
jgi:hypothetical protein